MKARIVTICVKGKPFMNNESQNIRKKEEICSNVIKECREKWGKIDAFVFPGGFFGIKKYIGNLSYRERVHVLSKTSFHKLCKKNSGNSLVIAGVDSTKPKKSIIKDQWGDQLCVAWNNNGIVGIGRKIFPVDGEEAKHYVCYQNDFKDKKRIVKLPNGKNAVLCACYDMFGCSENYNNYEKRTKYIRHIFPLSQEHDFRKLRRKYVEEFIKLLNSEKVTIGIVAIHRDPTRYWQCHGIDTCSAALNGIAIGASHFSYNLPMADKITLAAYKKPKKILKLKDKRKRVSLKNNETYKPKNFFYKDNKHLVRLFEF